MFLAEITELDCQSDEFAFVVCLVFDTPVHAGAATMLVELHACAVCVSLVCCELTDLLHASVAHSSSDAVIDPFALTATVVNADAAIHVAASAVPKIVAVYAVVSSAVDVHTVTVGTACLVAVEHNAAAVFLVYKD